MNVTLVGAAVAGGLLTALLAAGCGTQRGDPPQGTVHQGTVHQGTVHQGTVQACANFGVRAIERHIRVTRKPAACEGLSRAEVNLAVGKAIYLVAGGRHKAAWRRRAAQASAWLGYLISAPQDTALPRPPGYSTAGSSVPVRRGSGAALGFAGLGLAALGFAALGAWILAAGSGSYILAGWLAHGGIRRLRAGSAGRARGASLSPAVIFGHFGLAAAGLLVWISYLATDEAGLAWTAVGLLLPVAGLGMAMVTIGLSGERADAFVASNDAAAVAGTAYAVTAVGLHPIQTAPAGRRLSVLVVVAHGLLAAGTILLVLLAALGASGI